MTAEGVLSLDPVISPMPGANQQDALGIVSRASIAQEVWKQHLSALRARRQRDLISERLLLHCDGSGDNQWADLYGGQRVEIPSFVSEYRKTENVLGLIVENAVAHHTSQRFRFGTEFSADWRSREVAIVDTLFANYLSDVQRLNAKVADALYMAMSTGFCALHGYWTEDATYSWTDPISGAVATLPGPGMLDIWVGNPFDTVFDQAATKDSVRWCSYGRLLSADAVRKAFAHVPEAQGLQGSTKTPSADTFNRIGRKWRVGLLGLHGSPYMMERRDGEELLTVVCRETAPGVLTDWPQGRLTVIAVTGFNDPQRDLAGGTPVLLADQPLPAGRFSWKNIYSDARGNDIHGKPWVENKDQLQVDLNICLSEHWRLMIRQSEAPLITPGGAIGEDMADFGGYSILEVEPSLANWRPGVLEYPYGIVQSYEKRAQELRAQLFELGGFHAASRGESLGSRTAYRTVVALQQADSSIHGPMNERLQDSVLRFMGEVAHPNFVAFGVVPWDMSAFMGDQYQHLVDPYIDNTRVSQNPPRYKLVNSWGSPEVRTQELLDYLSLKGADGEVVLPTAEFRKMLPNPLIFGDRIDAKIAKQRRAATIGAAFRHQATLYREQTGLQETAMSHPWVQQAGMLVFQQMEVMYERMQDDDLEMNIAAMSEITQDEMADAIARVAAKQRLGMLYQWQMQMAMQGQPQPQMGAQPQQGTPAPQERPGGQNPRGVAVERGRPQQATQ